MPTYEYECEKCDETFELVQSMRDQPLKTCPKELCRMKTWGKGKVKRLLGTGGPLIFKGSGFYTTDYRSEGYKASAKKDAADATPAKPAESKPAASSTETKSSIKKE